MKIFNIKNLAAVFVLMLMSSSCSNWIDSDLNIDPDSPGDVPMNLLLPAIEQSIGYNLLGNDAVGTTNIWMQQFDGTDRQSSTQGAYQLNAADVNNLWNTIYIEMLINSQIMIDKARTEGSESPNYEGVGQVLQALTLGVTTDLWGDIPFSDALNGANNVLKPTYDSQEQIYDVIFTKLDEAIVNLNNTNNVFNVKGDVIYDGNMSKWTKAAYSIKARHELQLSNVNGNEAYTRALAAAVKGLSSNADDMLVPWEVANSNPIFQFDEQRTDRRMASTLVDMLTTNDDPRLPFYAAEDEDGNYTGSIPGSDNFEASLPGEYPAGETAPSRLMLYSEVMFIQAECYFRLGQTANAQAAYEKAVAASILRATGAANQAWLDANINGIAVTLETILTQKYIDGFATNQPYDDWRRTGIPSLSISSNAVINQIPTRFPYPQDELDYNAANVPSALITDKVWWDQ